MKNTLKCLPGWQMLALLLTGAGFFYTANADCLPQPMTVVLATPFSSRIDRTGDPLQAILNHTITLPTGQTLPAGTLLKGQVIGIQAANAKESGKIRIRFSQAITADATPYRISAAPATTDGWLRQQDADTGIWYVSQTRSTRLLNDRLQRRLGTDRAVWAQILGIHENVIPDPSSDAFMIHYNRHDVLAGAGDIIQLNLACP